jgi:NTE family protein
MYVNIENVLILQGGDSLGAFGCGVFKALANSNIKLDTIAGRQFVDECFSNSR